jgi:CBS domain-containing protein
MTASVIAVGPDTHAKAVARLLREHGIGAVPVVDSQRRLLGIISETDLLALETVTDMRRRESVEPVPVTAPDTAGEVMSTEVIWLDADTDAGEAARIMTSRNLRHVPVVEHGRLAGMLSRRDLLGMLARSDSDIEEEIRAVLDEELGRHPRIRVEDGTLLVDVAPDSTLLSLVEVLASGVPGIVAVRPGRF